MKQRMPRWVWAVPLLAVLGCGEARPGPAHEQSATPKALPSHFDSATAGSIRGKVVCDGDLPEVSPFEIRSLVTPTSPPQPRLIRENPNAPSIDPESKGVAGAVVFLRKVDASNARPWDHPPVTVDHDDRRMFVIQGDTKSNVGFVRQGSSITMNSREKVYNNLHVGGAAYFTVPFPDPDRPLTRVLKDQGLVELTSAAGYYWMQSYLFVSDHPYFVRTDAKGEFELRQVPPGRYTVVCWLPNWNKKIEDRDPESSLVIRVFFRPPLEKEREIVVDTGAAANVEFAISMSDMQK